MKGQRITRKERKEDVRIEEGIRERAKQSYERRKSDPWMG
jgi:hypothetical protein